MSEKVILLDQSNFHGFIEKADKPVLVDFYADWCGPCKMQSPVIDAFAEENSDKIFVAKANTDNCYGVCLAYSIASIPTLLLFKDGQVVEKSIGLTSKEELTEMIAKHV